MSIDIAPNDIVPACDPSPVPWPSSRPLLARVIEILPTIANDAEAGLVEDLAVALVGRDEALDAMRALACGSLGAQHDQHLEIARLKNRNITLLDEQRRARTAP